MKVPPRNIESFVKSPKPEARAILIYGPDEGLVRERMNVMTKNICPDMSDPFGVTEISAPKLSETPSLLTDEAMSISMMGDKKVVRLVDATDKATKIVKETLPALNQDSNLILVAAGELSPRSSLRLLFEKAENAAAIPCYVDDERSIARIINEGIREAGYSITSDAATYMASNVVGDRAIARSEIAKLATYMGNESKNINIDDVIACVGNSADLSMDGIAKNVAAGRFAEADRVLNHVLSEGITAVAVLRSLQNYFMRLHMTKARVEQGDSLDTAMKKLRPPIFFKAKAPFEAQVRNWGLPQLEQALSLITSVEAKCKQTANKPETLCGRLILSLSQVGTRAFGRRR